MYIVKGIFFIVICYCEKRILIDILKILFINIFSLEFSWMGVFRILKLSSFVVIVVIILLIYWCSDVRYFNYILLFEVNNRNNYCII